MSDLALLNIYKNPTSLAVSLDATSPIHGSGSLRVERTTGVGGHVNAVLNSGSRAFTSGRLRCACKFASVPTMQPITLIFMQGQEDLTVTGVSYGCQAQFNWDGSNNNRIQLLKFNLGTTGGATVLFTSPNFALAANTPMTFQVTWVLDPTNYQGVLMHVEKGAALDFSDLAAVSGLSYVAHTSGYLTGSVGEGAHTSIGGSGGAMTIDRLHSFRIVAGG